MIYPEFLKSGDTVAVCAPSAGVAEKDHLNLDLSLSHLKQRGWKVSETESVRSGLSESAPPDIRGAELNQLLKRDDVKAIICATGGDFLISMLPFVDVDAIRSSPKWVQGYSDPTGLLYYMTTVLDIATIYGVNAGGFFMKKLHPSLSDGLDILEGNIKPQHSFYLYESDRSARDGGYNLTERVEWLTPNGDVNISGRLLGGCLDCINDIIGTRFDGTLDFISRYRDDGIIWYFDIFAMKSESVHNLLFKMKDMGCFSNARGFVFGRVCYPDSFSGMSYIDAAKKVLGDAPMIFDADIGHVPPKMTLINGAMGTFECRDKKGLLSISLE